MAYQEIMQKSGNQINYYATQSDTLSNKQAKLNADWEEMKRQLSEALVPALTAFKGVIIDVAEQLINVGDAVAVAIRYITIFAEDVYSTIRDIMSLNLGQINSDWNNNYQSVMNSTAALGDATSAANNNAAATNAQNAAQKALNKSVNANTMSFDQLHNITNSGTAAALTQADAVNNLADALGNLKNSGMNNVTNTQGKGVVIPVSFKIPPFPPIPKPPAVTVPVTVQNNVQPALSQAESAVKGFSPSSVLVPLNLQDNLQPGLAQAQTAVNGWKTNSINAANEWERATNHDLSSVKQYLGQLAPAFNASETSIKNWATQTSHATASWKTQTGSDLSAVTDYLGGLNTAFAASAQSIKTWKTGSDQSVNDMQTTATSGISGVSSSLTSLNMDLTTSTAKMNNWKETGDEAMNTWSANSTSNLQKVLASVNNLISAYSTLKSLEQSLSNNNGSNPSPAATNWLAPVGEALNSISSGIGQSIESAIPVLGSLGAGGLAALALSPIGLATGGIVTAPTLAMVGEGGGPEAVIPLDRLGSVLNNGSQGMDGSSQSGSQPINITLKLDGRTLARATYSYNVNETERIGSHIGYPSAFNYPL
jgi:hypothetical protein